MSLYKGHIFGSIIAFFVYAIALYSVFHTRSIFDWIILLLLCIAFTLFPDIDIHSVGQKWFYRLFIVIDVIFIMAERYKEAAFLGLLAMIPIISKHRGWTHSVWSAFIIPLPIFAVPILIESKFTWIGLPYYLSAFVGYITHLAMDGVLWKKN